MPINLWTDVDALERLARSGRVAERGSRRGARLGPVPAPGAFPPFPRRPELDLYAVNAPARVVTGDYYDFFFVNEDRLAVVMADVSGKGIPAALLMGVTRSIVRNVSADCSSPGETLGRVNKILCDARLGSMYVTIFLGCYDVRSGELRYANAGHPRPYVVSSGGEVRLAGEVTGPILGILEVGQYGEAEDRLAPGERLVLYTDGVTEARSAAGNFFGQARLRTLLAELAAEPVERLCRVVAREVETFQTGRRQDDATILALERRI